MALTNIRVAELAFSAGEGVLAFEVGSNSIGKRQCTIEQNRDPTLSTFAGKPVMILDDQSTFRFVPRRHA